MKKIYRKYPNGYLNFIAMGEDDCLEPRFNHFKIIKSKDKSIIVIVPYKENPKWRDKFRSINKPLSSNYLERIC